MIPENLKAYIEKTDKFPTLYTKIVRGRIEKEHYWNISVVENDDGTATIFTIHGDVGGKEPIPTTEIISEGKNIGKKNETTPYEQALKQAISKFTKMYEHNSYLSLEDNNKIGVEEEEMIIYPMLATKYEPGDLKFPFYVSPKYDGIRCTAHVSGDKVYLVTRDNNKINGFPHLKSELMEVLTGDFYLDGELYSDVLKFEEISGLTRKKEPTDEDIEKMKLIYYYVFDTFDLDNLNETFDSRYKKITKMIKGFNHLKLTPIDVVKDEKQVMIMMDNYVKQGFEGIIMRNPSGPYKLSTGKGQRSSDLLKLKPSEKEFVRVLDIGIKKQTSKVSIVISCMDSKGIVFSVTGSGKEEYRTKLLQNKDLYLGKSLLISYDSKTKTGKPRFARVVTDSNDNYVFQ